VTSDTQEVPGTTDQVDINVKVTEKPTGALQLGAGFSSAEKLFLSFSINQENFFGTGNSLGIQVNTSQYNQIFQVNTTDPYFTEDGVSRTLNIYKKNSRPYLLQNGDYNLNTSGLGVSFGIPFAEIDTVFVGISYERSVISYSDVSTLPTSYRQIEADYGRSVSSLPVTIGWARDGRDSVLVPNTGRLTRLNSEIGVGGDTRYVKNSLQYQEYWPLTKKYTLAVNAELGVGAGYSGKAYPAFKNYYSGGLGSVRGFQQSSIQTDYAKSINPNETYPVGGSKKILLNTEFLAPFPGVGADRTLRLYTFFDVGNVFIDDEKVDLDQLRTSAGLGLSWVSPVGPLRFAWAKPIKKFEGDRMQSFQFQIGTAF
jgi:outer membrane protein insertion porin family